jgi:hypothetical protein
MSGQVLFVVFRLGSLSVVNLFQSRPTALQAKMGAFVYMWKK